jgi:hypothetical protein
MTNRNFVSYFRNIRIGRGGKLDGDGREAICTNSRPVPNDDT